MRRVRVAAAVAAGLAVLAIVTPPALADQPPATGTITVEPLSGPPGLPFFFSGGGCVSEAGPGLVEVLVFLGEELITTLPPEFSGIDGEGSWRVGMVPIGFFPSGEAAVGDWHATATCRDAETGDVVVEYAAAPFTVTAPPAPPSTAPPTTTTTVPALPPAAPAAPVAARPTFTG